MTRAAWVCDACESNNLASAAGCRVCQTARGSTARRIASPKPVPPSQPYREKTRPLFVESRHKTGPPAFAITPVAPPRPSVPPPVPSPVVLDPPRSGGSGRAVLGVAMVLGLLVLYIVIAFSSDDTPSDALETSAPAACPAQVAQWLPGGGTSSVLVASYTTDRHEITVCRDAAGQPYYDGRRRDAVVTSDTHISLRATETATGFTAVNGAYAYEVRSDEVVVWKGGTVLSRAELTRVAP